MVRYELALILRAFPTSQLKNIFKNTSTIILEEGAILRQLNNCGECQLPYRMRAHSQWFDGGRYLICDMEAGPQMAKNILKRLRDSNTLIRASMVKLKPRTDN